MQEYLVPLSCPFLYLDFPGRICCVAVFFFADVDNLPKVSQYKYSNVSNC